MDNLKESWQRFWEIWADFAQATPKARAKIEEAFLAAKQDLFDLFGGQVSLKSQAVLEDASQALDSAFARIPPDCPSPELAEIIKTFFRSLGSDELVQGRWLVEEKQIAGHSLKFCKDTKLGKVLRDLLKKVFPAIQESELQTALAVSSQIIQNVASHAATVVVSLDPLDFLLASEATTGWTSCFSLDGMYRAGPLSFLLDSCTVIAYAYRKLDNFFDLELPKKIWRQWIFISIPRARAYFSRQYPQGNEAFESAARRLIAYALAKKHGVNAEWTLQRNPERPFNFGSNLVYRDPLSAKIVLKSVTTPLVPVIEPATDVPCPVCGEGLVEESDRLVCAICAGLICCERCGRFVSDEDAYWGPDDDPLCETCFEEHCARCEDCEEVFWIEDLHEIAGCFFCENCYDELPHCEACDEPYPQHKMRVGFDGAQYCPYCFCEGFLVCSKCKLNFASAPWMLSGTEFGKRVCSDCKDKEPA